MERLEPIAEGIRSRPVLAVFGVLAALPTVLAVVSFRQPVALPYGILPAFEFLFRLLVYAPVAFLRTVLLEPIGLGVLFAVPGLEQAAVVATLLGFYYVVSHLLVRLGRVLIEGLSEAGLEGR
ncbi:hypothetical protein SAMN05444422_101358 [Halobiforma haloterrestris]|uniref:Uncharacterized protein n=1 Tax=Natronobacterium haloterrestre TaxID=148448 RepID=A0A1I1DDW7_NATHA|nr:hypothetical protein [Halobiforma haloterrestris]SFB70723.1 hypothetical protein SAMN05444422_101358 [Halobiforma haloterrestris]